MRPLILITNDDGINSPGLTAVAEAVYDLGDILVIAPNKQQTSMGRAFPRTEDQGIIDEVSLSFGNKSVTAYSVHGSPAYAVAHGVLEIADRKPDLCISGINYGENLGLNLTCSGTLGAVFEADSHGIPGIAVSKQVEVKYQHSSNFAQLSWDVEKLVVRMWAEKILREGMPMNTSILNINVPEGLADARKYKITTQSRQNNFEFIKPGKRNLKLRYELKSVLKVDEAKLEADSDIYAVYKEHVVSVTPLTWNMSVIHH
jgi:5'-nucleotidase